MAPPVSSAPTFLRTQAQPTNRRKVRTAGACGLHYMSLPFQLPVHLQYPLLPSPRRTQTQTHQNLLLLNLVAPEARPGPSAVSAACCKLCAAGGVRACGFAGLRAAAVPSTDKSVPASIADISLPPPFCSMDHDSDDEPRRGRRFNGSVQAATADLKGQSKGWSAHSILATAAAAPAASALLTGTMGTSHTSRYTHADNT